MTAKPSHRTPSPVVRYDRERQRVWVGSQRLHHGLVGTVIAAAGIALMAHDWHDRRVWFSRGPQI